MHWYKRNIGDYHKKAGRLSILQHGVYTLLMDACYDREQFPTREQAIEWTWASSQDEINAVDLVLSKFFTEIDGVFVQKRIEEEVFSYQERASKNKRIAQERERTRRELKQTVNESSTNRAQDVNESPPNHKPITKNQEPLEEIMVANAPLPTKAEATPYARILDVYKSILVPCGMVNTQPELSSQRKSKLKTFWKQASMDLEKFTAYCQYIADNCTWMHVDRDNGRGGKWGRKDLFYICKQETYLRVKEDAANDR